METFPTICLTCGTRSTITSTALAREADPRCTVCASSDLDLDTVRMEAAGYNGLTFDGEPSYSNPDLRDDDDAYMDCPNCHKPFYMGDEFCSHCGKRPYPKTSTKTASDPLPNVCRKFKTHTDPRKPPGMCDECGQQRWRHTASKTASIDMATLQATIGKLCNYTFKTDTGPMAGILQDGSGISQGQRTGMTWEFTSIKHRNPENPSEPARSLIDIKWLVSVQPVAEPMGSHLVDNDSFIHGSKTSAIAADIRSNNPDLPDEVVQRLASKVALRLVGAYSSGQSVTYTSYVGPKKVPSISQGSYVKDNGDGTHTIRDNTGSETSVKDSDLQREHYNMGV